MFGEVLEKSKVDCSVTVRNDWLESGLGEGSVAKPSPIFVRQSDLILMCLHSG